MKQKNIKIWVVFALIAITLTILTSITSCTVNYIDPSTPVVKDKDKNDDDKPTKEKQTDPPDTTERETLSSTEPTPVEVLHNTPLTSQEIAKLCTPAVFYIEIYDDYGYALSSGSGFFLTDDGVAVTNYHVMDGAYSAQIKTTSDEWYKVLGYYYLNEYDDIAVIKVGSPAGVKFPVLKMGDPDKIEQGERVYAIGSPFGLDNTFTDGLISNTHRDEFIQHTAPISAGNSGGALINSFGEVIGVNTAVIETFGNRIGQNLNLAVPITAIDIDSYKYNSPEPLSEAPWLNNNYDPWWDDDYDDYYDDYDTDDYAYIWFPHVPDFGWIYDEYILDWDEFESVDDEGYDIYMYWYLLDTSWYDPEDFKDDYDYALEWFGFSETQNWVWEEDKYDYGVGADFRNSSWQKLRYNWFDDEVYICIYY